MQMEFEAPVFARCKAKGSDLPRLAVGTLPVSVEIEEVDRADAPGAMNVEFDPDQGPLSYVAHRGHLYVDLTFGLGDFDADVFVGSSDRLVDMLYAPSMHALSLGLRGKKSASLPVFPEKTGKMLKSRAYAAQLSRISLPRLSEIDAAQVERCLDIFRLHAATNLVLVDQVPHHRAVDPVLAVSHRYGTIRIEAVRRDVVPLLPYDTARTGDSPPFAYFPINAMKQAKAFVACLGRQSERCKTPVVNDMDAVEFRHYPATLYGIAQNLVEGFALSFTDQGFSHARRLLADLSADAISAYQRLEVLVMDPDHESVAEEMEGPVETVMNLPDSQKAYFHGKETGVILDAAYRLWSERPISISQMPAPSAARG